MSKFVIVRSDELYHHGIKGQKWGIRKYQNEDGSLTPEGRERYGVGDVPNRQTDKMFKMAIKNASYDRFRKNEQFKALANDDDIQAKKAEYKKAKHEWYKLSKGEDFDAYDDETGYDVYGITPKQFQKIQQLDKKMRAADKELEDTVRAKVKDFTSNYVNNPSSKVKIKDEDIERVNRFISLGLDVELYRYKQR